MSRQHIIRGLPNPVIYSETATRTHVVRGATLFSETISTVMTVFSRLLAFFY